MFMYRIAEVSIVISAEEGLLQLTVVSTIEYRFSACAVGQFGLETAAARRRYADGYE